MITCPACSASDAVFRLHEGQMTCSRCGGTPDSVTWVPGQTVLRDQAVLTDDVLIRVFGPVVRAADPTFTPAGRVQVVTVYGWHVLTWQQNPAGTWDCLYQQRVGEALFACLGCGNPILPDHLHAVRHRGDTTVAIVCPACGRSVALYLESTNQATLNTTVLPGN